MSNWIFADRRLCATQFRGSCGGTRHQDNTGGPIVVSARASTDCSLDTVKAEFYQQLHVPLEKANWTDVMILVRVPQRTRGWHSEE